MERRAKAHAMLKRCGYAAGGATFLGHIRDGYDEGDWTNNLDRVRPKRGQADPGMQIKPPGTDRAMEDVYTPDLQRDSTEPLKRDPNSY
jgi:hypothetical protein